MATLEREALQGRFYSLYIIDNGSPVRLMDFIAAIEQELGLEAIKDMLPMQPGDVEQTWADTSGLERDFGYRPTTCITEGVRQFIRWYSGILRKLDTLRQPFPLD